MEEQWYADRCRLRELLRAHPDWSKWQLAEHTGRSPAWVKKWRRRLRDATPGDEQVLWGHSRARRQPPAPRERAVVERILDLRDHPPAHLGRVPGPRAILYYLQQDADLVATGVRLPRSTRTVWQVLRRHGRIALPPPRRHEPLDRPPPLTARTAPPCRPTLAASGSTSSRRSTSSIRARPSSSTRRCGPTSPPPRRWRRSSGPYGPTACPRASPSIGTPASSGRPAGATSPRRSSAA